VQIDSERFPFGDGTLDVVLLLAVSPDRVRDLTAGFLTIELT